MTRKDYVLIAAAFKRSQPNDGPAAYRVWQAAACALADDLVSTNPRFDRERFLKAAGVRS
jgi:hypothetical protein